MPSRHRSRERALQMVFQWDQSRAPAESIMADYWGSLSKDEDSVAPEPDLFANNLLTGVVKNIDVIDALITKHAQNWRIERMSTVDRSILRLGICEMMREPSLAPVVIDEAIEIGRRFSEDSGPFLNGILDAVRRSLEGGDPEPEPAAGAEPESGAEPEPAAGAESAAGAEPEPASAAVSATELPPTQSPSDQS